MNIALHYGVSTYRIPGGEERATEIVKEIRATIAAGGGTIDLATESGSVNLVIGPHIPLAVELIPEPTVFV